MTKPLTDYTTSRPTADKIRDGLERMVASSVWNETPPPNGLSRWMSEQSHADDIDGPNGLEAYIRAREKETSK